MTITAKDKRYRRKLSELPCCACKIQNDTVCGHHLTWLRRGKNKALEKHQVPLCYECHIEKLHRHGEKTFWKNLGKTLAQVQDYAERLYKYYHEDEK